MTEEKVNETVLKQFPTEDLCRESIGVVACLIKTWVEKVSWDASQPLLLVFPGACAANMRRLGAAANRLKEIEDVREGSRWLAGIQTSCNLHLP